MTMLIQLHVWQDSERGMRHLLGKAFTLSMGKGLPQSRISQLIIYATPIFLHKHVHLFLIKRFQPHETSSNKLKHPPCPLPFNRSQLSSCVYMSIGCCYVICGTASRSVMWLHPFHNHYIMVPLKIASISMHFVREEMISSKDLCPLLCDNEYPLALTILHQISPS